MPLVATAALVVALFLIALFARRREWSLFAAYACLATYIVLDKLFLQHGLPGWIVDSFAGLFLAFTCYHYLMVKGKKGT
jgi:hypothetical protein